MSSSKKLTTLGLLVLFICAVSSWQVQAEAADEAQLIAVLQSAAPPVEKEDACRQLKLIGTAKAVPALATMLADEHLYQAGCDALETMPFKPAEAALLAALENTEGKTKAGIIHAIGEYRLKRGEPRNPSTVSLLAPLLKNSDPMIASAAARALGEIGGRAAASALQNAVKTAAGPIRSACVDALLRCAWRMEADNDWEVGARIFQQFNDPKENENIRTAAFRSELLATYAGGYPGTYEISNALVLKLVISGIEGDDNARQLAGLQFARDIYFDGLSLNVMTYVKAFTNLLLKVSPAKQATLICLLQQKEVYAAAPALLELVGSKDSYVRCTALAALGTLGDVTVIPLLADAATSNDEAAQKAARQALIQLHRGKVADAMVAQLVLGNDKVQVELIRALTARAESSAAPQLLELARSHTGSSRRAALRAMEHFADGTHIPSLVQLMKLAKDDAARAEVRSVFEALADRTGEGRKFEVTPIVEGLTSADVETRIALLQVSAFFADAGLRTAFRAALRDTDAQIRNAAARALCQTRDAELMPDLLELARAAGELNLRALALEGYVRLACDNERLNIPPQKRVELLKPALALATRPEDKRLILAGLAEVPHPEALALAEQACADASVQAEAEIACLQIAKALVASDSTRAEAFLSRLAGNASNHNVRTNAQAMMKQFSTDWLCAGPYRQEGKSGGELFDVAFAPDQPGLGAVNWRGIAGVADLTSVAAGDNCVVYLKTRVFLPAAQPVIFEIGSDDGIKLWVNNEVTHANNTDRGVVPGQDKVKASLRQGWNDLLAKITQNGGGCGLSLRITAIDGSEIPGLRFDPRGEARPPGASRSK